MPNGQALYDSIRDCLACSQLHTRSALYDGMIYNIKYNLIANQTSLLLLVYWFAVDQ